MDSQQQWNDFHILNTVFSDVVESQGTKWIQTSLVRMAYRGGKDKTTLRSVRGIDGLTVEYAVPFPLTYVFTPKVLQMYGYIFVFLLQIRRAKGILERILVRDTVSGAPQFRTELKVL